MIKMNDKPPYVIPDKMLEISEGLLEDIRHELACIDKWYAFEPMININLEKEEHTIINNKEMLIQLDFKDLIKKIDKLLDE